MNERDQQILDGAIAAFARYGPRKTTMGDIAEQAGISRQTLYARFANKSEIMLAAMELISERVVEAVSEAWKGTAAISERIDIFLDLAIIRFFDQIQQMPDASDLLTGQSDEARAAQSVANTTKVRLLAELFETRAEMLAAHGSSPHEFAEFFYSSASTFKFTARDASHLRQLLMTLKRTTMFMLGEESA
ncbi:TetR/AcrR family transcriptional regulator [Hoeflea sp.]|uniref:TetR/AcrR family transcriptional regulator n=1 Tax=Hoeflea sp. TaxID=1940281 RepID=UPI003B529270